MKKPANHFCHEQMVQKKYSTPAHLKLMIRYNIGIEGE